MYETLSLYFLFPTSCSVIHFLMEKMPLKWLLVHQLTFVMAFLYVLLDLTNEVSSGTVTLAKEYMDRLLTQVSIKLAVYAVIVKQLI